LSITTAAAQTTSAIGVVSVVWPMSTVAEISRPTDAAASPLAKPRT
jgi:hypothetical protein